ncbi:hypothetical protein F0L68_18065 [Solihabitans fulvus]|uniref:DUF4352 domain-containing protein n=1 Tax=Solihabitans fulvus TaxID=1892852 RepID=A0A5B2XD99_9PSEU|nr:hypothetical protein [Solihabitans fulvus]KAA2261144.1 hypothetical protein F0L68_18065 [Solihabitans fulvus]
MNPENPGTPEQPGTPAGQAGPEVHANPGGPDSGVPDDLAPVAVPQDLAPVIPIDEIPGAQIPVTGIPVAELPAVTSWPQAPGPQAAGQQTTGQFPSFQPAPDQTGVVPHAPVPESRSNRNLWIGLGAAGLVVVLLFVVIAVSLANPPKNENRAAPVRPSPSFLPPVATRTPAFTTPRIEEPKTVPVGQQVSLRTALGDTYTLSVSPLQLDLQRTSPYAPRAKNGSYASTSIQMVATQTKATSVMANSISFKIVYADGTAVPSTPGLDMPGTPLVTVSLSEGQKAAGDVYFDVDPARLAGAKIEFEYLGRVAAFWTL